MKEINPTLRKYIDVIEALNPADGYMVVDIDLVYQAVSQSVIDVHGDPNMVGKKLKQLNSPLAVKAPYYRENSLAVMASTHNFFRKIAKVRTGNDIILFDMRSSKIFDEQNNQLVGIASFFYKLIPNLELRKLLSVSGDEVYLEHPETEQSPLFMADHSFNYRERCIIWLLTMGKTRKEIAVIITQFENNPISENTITTIINRNIYPQLEVNNYSNFMKKITAGNVLSSIPHDLINYFSKNKPA